MAEPHTNALIKDMTSVAWLQPYFLSSAQPITLDDVKTRLETLEANAGITPQSTSQPQAEPPQAA